MVSPINAHLVSHDAIHHVTLDTRPVCMQQQNAGSECVLGTRLVHT